MASEMGERLALYPSIDGRCGASRVVGRWLLLTLGEAEPDDEGDDDEGYLDPSEFWEDVASLLGRIHDRLPLEEVHFLGTREPGDDPWSAWSVVRKDKPGPAPLWFPNMVSNDWYGVGMERFEAEPVEVDLRRPERERIPAKAAPGTGGHGLRLVSSGEKRFVAPLLFSKDLIDLSRQTF